MSDLSTFLHLARSIVFESALLTLGMGIWIAMWIGATAGFKQWRLYSRHWAAVKIRRFLQARRNAKRTSK